MAPLTRNRAGEGNVPTALNSKYYVQRASAGLIITEASQISPQGVGYPATPGIHNAEQTAGWRRTTSAVQRAGGRIFLQLWHVGRISHPSLQPDGALPVAPSAICPAGEAVTYQGMQPFVTPRALKIDELPGIVEDYRLAAKNAKAAGFHGVEIHAANGYLLDQFLRDGSNHRSDDYGGSIDNRCRLLLQVIDAVTSVWDANRVGVRISPLNPFNDITDSDPKALFGSLALKLGNLGLAYLHVVEGAIGSDAPLPEFDFAALKAAYDGTYMANGGYTLERGNQAIADNLAELVSFGVPFISNPDLPRRFAQGADLNSADEATFYGGDEHGYTDYPSLREAKAET
jgi:N-ethylmaleimide reductase